MPADGPPTDPRITAAAWNAVAVASIAHREALDAADREHDRFAQVLASASCYGMTVADLSAASGLDQPYVEQLLAEGAQLRRAG